MENTRIWTILTIIWSLYVHLGHTSSCGRQRCCQLDPCTTLYCQQKNSQTWISTENFNDYQFTKLVMEDNQCKPCPNNCKTCTTTSSCTQCYSGYYLSQQGTCQLCDYKCLACRVVNDIKKCSECDDGTYLDDTSQTCKSCPMGAEKCSSQTTIITCLPGYQKSSNSLFCTACPSNCLSCPLSTSYCSYCSEGYYMSVGACNKCTVSNCDTCIGVGANVYCTKCSSGYIVQSGSCVSCPTHCTTCSSRNTCTKCDAGYYIIGGACSTASPIDNCLTYSSSNTCSVCQVGFYLSSNICYPCSILCQTCSGAHFGTCSSCADTASLFNQMCIADAFPSSNTYRKYMSIPADAGLLSGGSMSCSNLLYGSTSMSLSLNNLYGFKIVLEYKLFSQVSGQQYTVSLNDNSKTFATSSQGYEICNSSLLYLHHSSDNLTFAQIQLQNTLTFASTSASLIYFSQLLITVYKCNALCLQCSESQCYECLNQNLYTQNAYCVYICDTGYYTYQQLKKCVTDCPIATYPLLTNASCMPCQSPCYTCLSDTYCLSCVQGFFLTEDNLCEQECPYRFYGSVTTQKCEQCVGRCNQCISDEECLSCEVGFLENTSCVDDCVEEGYYEDLQTLKCEQCSPKCQQCKYAADFCLICPDSLIFFNNTCLSQCPSGYFSDGNECLSCDYPCEECVDTSLTCTSCIDSYLLDSTCISPCPDGYYEDNVNLRCQPCSHGCSQCYSKTDNCLECSNGFYWVDYKCVEDCPDGYYEDTYNDGLGICSPCANLCRHCTNKTFCQSCVSNFLKTADGQCVRASACPSGQYADIQTLQCLPCAGSCSTCKHQATKCTSCSDGLILYEYTCVSECPSSFYYNSSSECVLCESPCQTCIDETQCLSCQQGYKYSETTHVCSSTCSVGTFFNSTINDCSPCSQNCLSCQSSGFCYICENPYYLHVLQDSTNQCLETCPDGYFADGLSCMKCLYPCETCTSSIDCIICAYGVQYQNRCLSGCPDSTYQNDDKCEDCEGNCLTCKNSPLTCMSCIEGFYLYEEECVQLCPSGSFAFQVTKQCAKCPSTCSECTNSTYCTACITNTTYLNTETHSCLQYCPTGFYGNSASGECEACQSKCLTCIEFASNCQACSDQFLLVKLQNAEFDCMEDCPDGYYSDNGVCYKCMFPCDHCSSAVACITCATGTFLHQNSSSCLLTCPMGTYYSTQPNDTCEECIYPCETCLNRQTCISCQDDKYLLKGECLDSCPQMYYADSSGICNRCYGMCKTCTNKYYCLTCHSGFSYDGFCYSGCPPGTYASQQTKTCEPCNQPCLECSNSPDYCKRCQYNMFAYKGECSQSCPVGTYQSGDVCVVCQFPCTNCPDQFSCKECIGGYLLYMNSSCIETVEKCPNDLYKMDSKQCVPFTWCPSSYYRDQTSKTCSQVCSRGKYVQHDGRICGDRCNQGEYVSQNMVCKSWSIKPSSLMGMSAIVFIRSSRMHIAITFNETVDWDESGQKLFTIINKDLVSRRVLVSISESEISYEEVEQQELINTDEKDLILEVISMPYSVDVKLPAHYVHSQVNDYPLQNPQMEVFLPTYTPYTYQQVYTGSLLRHFSEGVSWFIILFSLFFLFMNRLSDVYILWDTAQLLYLLLFLNIQYPPNLNEFLAGMSNTHFLFVPSLFSAAVQKFRLVSDLPFYAYSFDCSFIRTAGSPILLILIIAIIFLLLKLFQLLNTKWQSFKQKLQNYPKIKQFVFKGILRFRWHHTSDTFFLSYDIIMLFAIAEISKISSNPNNAMSNAFAAIFVTIYLFFPCFVGYKLNKHYENISKGKMVANLQCFYRGIEKTNKFGVFLILLRYVRKIVYCTIIGVFSMQPMFALPILMFTSVLMGLFITINKPFKKRLSNMITIGTECILVITYILVALIKFNDDSLSVDLKLALGWVCCGILIIMIFGLIFEIFCKTMFYLEPQGKEKQVNKGDILLEKGEFSEQYLRKKAGQFFQFMFPKLKQQLNLDDSEDEFIGYEEGDSENSQNNDMREKRWGFDSEDSQRRSDQFRHYGGQSQSQTSVEKGDKKPPSYLIRCVKELH